ncbi:TPA: hypothetical protein ACNIDP_003283 [Klebsiella michiganensis]
MTNNQLTSTHLAVKSELDGYKIHASRGQATALAMVRLFESIDKDLKELQERRKAERDSEPVFNLLVSQAGYKGQKQGNNFGFTTLDAARELKEGKYLLYRHAQQPVVPDDVLDALQKVARIRLDLNDFDGDRCGIADCLGDAEEALIEVVNRRAAMLQGAENAESRCGNSPVIPDGYVMVPKEPTPEMQSAGASAIRIETTALNKLWTVNAVFRAMLAAAPQEEK